MSSLSFATLLSLSVIWGASFLLIKLGLQTLGPMTVATLRVAIGTVALFVIVRMRRLAIPRGWETWRHYVFMGALGIVVPFAAIAWGTQHIASGLSAILNATMPLFTILLASLWGDETLSARRVAGIVFGFGGIVILTAPQLSSGLEASLLGELAVLAASASYAVAIVYARHHLSDQPPLATALGQVGTGTLMFIPLALIEQPWLRQVSTTSLLSVIALGLFGTAIAYVLYYRLLQSQGATVTSLVTYIVPVFGVFWGRVILAERLDRSAFIALGAILVGVLVVSGFRLPSRRPKAVPPAQAE